MPRKRVRRTGGRVLIEIKSRKRSGLEAAITIECDDPALIAYSEEVVKKMVELAPGIFIRRVFAGVPSRPTAARRRGGPEPTPERDRIRIAKGWLEARGRIKQELYARSHGVSVATLRRWLGQLGREGKL